MASSVGVFFPPKVLKLTENLHLRDLADNADGFTETIRATEIIQPDGFRYLSLIDVLILATGKKKHNIEVHKSKYIDKLTKCEFVIETEQVLAGSNNNCWRPTPCIKSTQLVSLLVHYNEKFRGLSATTFARFVGGDRTLHPEIDENASSAVALSNHVPEKKMKLTENLHLGDLADNADGFNETIRATEIIQPDGFRYLSLIDVLILATGKKKHNIEVHKSKYIDKLTFSEFVIETEQVLAGCNNNCWRPTPCIKSTQLVSLLVHYNAKFRDLSATTFTRFVGGDEAMIEEVQMNRERQEVLAEHDPNNILRVAGEAVENRSPEIEASKQIVKRIMKTSSATKSIKTVNVFERFKISNGDVETILKNDSKRVNRFYAFFVKPKSPTKQLSNVLSLDPNKRPFALGSKHNKLCKIGYSTKFSERLSSHDLSFPSHLYDVEILLFRENRNAKDIEVEVKRELTRQKVLTTSGFYYPTGKPTSEKFDNSTELFCLDTKFNSTRLRALIENKFEKFADRDQTDVCTQTENEFDECLWKCPNTPTPKRVDAYVKCSKVENDRNVEIFKITADKDIEIAKITADKDIEIAKIGLRVKELELEVLKMRM